MARISRTTPAAALIAASLFAACAEDAPVAAAPPPAGPARLIVRESLPPQPVYIEGSVAFLRLQRLRSRAVVIDGPVTAGDGVRGRRPLFDRKVAPGTYRLVSYQRPCVGNCGYLDPPTDRCEATLQLAPHDLRVVTIVLSAGGGCRVKSRSAA
jgi:hypothetical protein